MTLVDEQYVKELEQTIERQQVCVDRFSHLIKRLDGMNIKMSYQDASNLIKPDAFVKWMENNKYWSKVSDIPSIGHIQKKYRYRDGSRETIIMVATIPSYTNNYIKSVLESFSIVWDFWLRDHKGGGLFSLLIEVLESEEESNV